MATSVPDAEESGQMFDTFLAGPGFRPAAAYGNVRPEDKRAPDGLAGALEMDALHRARSTIGFWMSDRIIPAAAGFVAAIGALSLLVCLRRHLYRESRRW